MRSIATALAVSIIGFLGAAPPAQAAFYRNETIAGLEVAIWSPDVPRRKSPVILFSHGFRGCNTQSKFLMNALADAGYAVFAPNHNDAACGNPAKWLERPDKSFLNARQWDMASYFDRAKNMVTLLNALEKDDRFALLDWAHVGMAGHSLGGYTVMGLAGAWPQWKDKRIKAVLAMSPYVSPFVLKRTLYSIEVPVMYQGGTRDFGITPFITQKDGALSQTLSPKMYLELNGAGHFAWTDLRDKYHATINAYAVAFFDHCLKNKPLAYDLPKGKGQVARVVSKM